MGLAQGTTDFEFLTNGKTLLGTHNLQFPDTTTLTTLQRNQIGNGAEVVLQFAIHEF